MPKSSELNSFLALDKQFWDQVDDTGHHWYWRGAKNDRAHIQAWEHLYAPIPDGFYIYAWCEDEACIRPNHYFINKKGTLDWEEKVLGKKDWRERKKEFERRRKDNPELQDRRKKITTQDVKDIRKMHKEGKTYTEISRYMGINVAYVLKICRGIQRKET